ncbi:MAG: hypothetical protein HY665_03175 [Chloroflexi bacterium]|nr:hypothetical protein [Chloroflexota bacterium]
MKKWILIIGVVLAVLVSGAIAMYVTAAPPARGPVMETGSGHLTFYNNDSTPVSFGNYPGVAHVSLTVWRMGDGGDLDVRANFNPAVVLPSGSVFIPNVGSAGNTKTLIMEFDTYNFWQLETGGAFSQQDVYYNYTVTYPGK